MTGGERYSSLPLDVYLGALVRGTEAEVYQSLSQNPTFGIVFFDCIDLRMRFEGL